MVSMCVCMVSGHTVAEPTMKSHLPLPISIYPCRRRSTAAPIYISRECTVLVLHCHGNGNNSFLPLAWLTVRIKCLFPHSFCVPAGILQHLLPSHGVLQYPFLSPVGLSKYLLAFLWDSSGIRGVPVIPFPVVDLPIKSCWCDIFYRLDVSYHSSNNGITLKE